MSTHEDLLNSAIVPWAIADENVTGLVELGSRVQDDPVDEWADMNLLVHLTNPEFRGLIGAGMRVLGDEEAEHEDLPPLPAPESLSPDAINQTDFDLAVQDSLFQVVWTTKHLRRGEPWAAKDDVDCYMRTYLAEVLEWHTVADRPDVRTGSGGRHLEDWANERFTSRLPETFTTSEASSVATVLIEAAALFGDVATETAEMLGFTYPIESYENIVGWMHTKPGPILDR